MSTKCECSNPDGGSTNCGAQNIALCIRGKDRECHGYCIPIPPEFNHVSNQFNNWVKNEVKAKVNEHVSNNPNLYNQDQNFKESFHLFEKEDDSDSLPKGTTKFSNEENEEINVRFAFSFEDRINPLEDQQLLEM